MEHQFASAMQKLRSFSPECRIELYQLFTATAYCLPRLPPHRPLPNAVSLYLRKLPKPSIGKAPVGKVKKQKKPKGMHRFDAGVVPGYHTKEDEPLVDAKATEDEEDLHEPKADEKKADGEKPAAVEAAAEEEEDEAEDEADGVEKKEVNPKRAKQLQKAEQKKARAEAKRQRQRQQQQRQLSPETMQQQSAESPPPPTASSTTTKKKKGPMVIDPHADEPIIEEKK